MAEVLPSTEHVRTSLCIEPQSTASGPVQLASQSAELLALPYLQVAQASPCWRAEVAALASASQGPVPLVVKSRLQAAERPLWAMAVLPQSAARLVFVLWAK